MADRSFKEYINNRFYDEFFAAVKSFMIPRRKSIDFSSRVVSDVDFAELSDVKVKCVWVDDREDMSIAFDVVIEAEVYIREYSRRYDTKEDTCYPWFLLSCTGDLSKGLDDFYIHRVDTYNSKSKQSRPLDDSLVPINFKEDLEAVAFEFLQKYYPEAIKTPMSLCTLESLAKGKIDYDDILNNFGKWYYNNEFTPTGNTFDVGTTCSFAIHNYHKANCTVETCGLDEEMANGNGSLMRIHPMALFTFAKGMSLGKSLDAIYKTSALTHAHPRSKLGCGIYSMLLWKLLESPSKEEAVKELENTYVFYDGGASVSEKEYDHCSELSHFDFAYKASLLEKTEDDIVGSGYIVDALEAALWCLLTTDSYRECVLKAVNLGDDTDTTAAIAGGLAGALYGLDAIPEEWLEKLKRRDYIEDMCERAYRAWIEN